MQMRRENGRKKVAIEVNPTRRTFFTIGTRQALASDGVTELIPVALWALPHAVISP